jgi:hypothetical protein
MLCIAIRHAVRPVYLKRLGFSKAKNDIYRDISIYISIDVSGGHHLLCLLLMFMRINRQQVRLLSLSVRPSIDDATRISSKLYPMRHGNLATYQSYFSGSPALYTSLWGQAGLLQDQWPWWQRTFLGRMKPKSHGVCACLRPSDPRSPWGHLLARWGVR